jgi:hypothetical protein
MSKQPGQIPYLSEVPLGLGNLYVSIFIADGQYPLDLVNVCKCHLWFYLWHYP